MNWYSRSQFRGSDCARILESRVSALIRLCCFRVLGFRDDGCNGSYWDSIEASMALFFCFDRGAGAVMVLVDEF